MIQSIVQTVNEVIGDATRPVPLHVPTFGGNCSKYVQECIDTGWVSSAGSFVSRFEEEAAAYTGAKFAVAVGTGTAGLHIALRMVGVEPGDHVLCPSLTFVATANAIRYCDATPHFVDVAPDTLGVDPVAIDRYLKQVATRRDDGGCYLKEGGGRLRALIGMHTFGHPFDVVDIHRLCKKWGIAFVEDAAESLGSFAGDQHTGTFAHVGVISFNGNKIITTGGGGMILTDDAPLAQWAKHVTTTAKCPHRWAYHHDEVGYNYRLPNLNAALGCAQLEQLDGLLAQKRALAERYIEAFSDVSGAKMLTEPEGTRSNYWLNALVLDRDLSSQRDAVLEALCDSGLLVRPIWEPLHTLPMYRDCPSMPLPVTDDRVHRVINLPSTAGL